MPYDPKESKILRAKLAELVREKWPCIRMIAKDADALSGASWIGVFKNPQEYALECSVAYSKSGNVKEVTMFWVDYKNGMRRQLRKPEIQKLALEFLK
jgi:hypothetical protein